MKKVFYTVKEFEAMQARATAAEKIVSGVKAHFGEAAEADGFDVVAAVSSLGEPKGDGEEDTDKVADLESKLANANARIAELEKTAGAEATTTTAETDGGGSAATGKDAGEVFNESRKLYESLK